MKVTPYGLHGLLGLGQLVGIVKCLVCFLLVGRGLNDLPRMITQTVLFYNSFLIEQRSDILQRLPPFRPHLACQPPIAHECLIGCIVVLAQRIFAQAGRLDRRRSVRNVLICLHSVYFGA